MRRRTLSEQVVSATFWNALLLPARFVVGLLASVIYYERLSREQVGLVFLLTSLASTLGLYADLGLERSLPRFLPEVEERAGRAGVRALLRRVLGLKVAVLALVLVALALLARPLVTHLAERERGEATRLQEQARQAERTGEHGGGLAEAVAKRALADEVEHRGVLLLGAVGLLVVLGAFFDVHMQFLTAYFRQRSWNLISLVNTLLQPVLVTTFVLLGFGVPGVVLGLVLTPACALVLAIAQARRVEAALPDVPGSLKIPDDLKTRFAGYSGMTYLHQITTWLYDLDVIVLLSAATLGLRDTALLGFAYKFARDTLGYVWTPLTGVMTPLLSRVKTRDDAGALQDAQASLSRIVWLLLVPSLAGMLLLSPRLLPVLYPKYTEAVPLVALFLVFAFAESMLSVPQNVLMVCERYKPVVISRLLAAACIPLVALLLPAYGLFGVALAVGIARIVARLYTVAAGARLLGLRLPWAFGAKVGLSSAAMSAVLFALLKLLPSTGPVSGTGRVLALLPLMGFALLGAASFLIALSTLAGLEEQDRRRLERLRFPGKQALLRFLAP